MDVRTSRWVRESMLGCAWVSWVCRVPGAGGSRAGVMVGRAESDQRQANTRLGECACIWRGTDRGACIDAQAHAHAHAPATRIGEGAGFHLRSR